MLPSNLHATVRGKPVSLSLSLGKLLYVDLILDLYTGAWMGRVG